MTEDQQRFALRLVALGGLWLLVSGLLLALSLVTLALTAFALLLLVVIALGTVAFLRRVDLGERVWAVATSAARAGERFDERRQGLEVRRRVRRVTTPIGRGAAATPALAASGSQAAGRVLKRLGARIRDAAKVAPDRLSDFSDRALRAYALVAHRLTLVAWRLLGERRRDEALRLNELGAELRRRGDHESAAEQHRVALEIARGVGDEQAEALTLNSLALALAQGGAEAEAVEHLEQALVVLRELGDVKHEARVMANLGIVHRRQGRGDEAVMLLHEALEKLPPESRAYLQVKQELGRPS